MAKRAFEKCLRCGAGAEWLQGSPPPTLDQLREEFRRGVKAAASFAGEWDKQINHPYRFEDVILCKFNLTTRKKPRLKRARKGERKDRHDH